MALSVEQFRNITPAVADILIYESGGIVQAVNVSTTTCDGVSTGEALSDIDTLILNISGTEYNVTVLNSIPKSGYYTLVIIPFAVSSTTSIGSCTLTYLLPGVTEVGFNNSDYNAVISNAVDVRRAETQIFDVDRRSNLSLPSNLTAILSGSAIAAEVQDSFYSDTGLIRARYEGTKTTKDDYSGVSPTLNVVTFTGAIYDANTSINSICSQSYDERALINIGFDSLLNFNPNDQSIPTASLQSGERDGRIIGSPAIVTDTQTVIETNVFNVSADRIVPGRILYITNNTVFDYAEIVKVENLGAIDSIESLYRLTVIRGVNGSSKTIEGNLSGVPDYSLNIKTVDGDVIYEFEKNKPVTVSNKRLYIQETGEIYKVGPKGKILYREETCSI